MARGYLEIDGKRIELTNEQVEKLLGAEEIKKNPFEKGEDYYFITPAGNVRKDFDTDGCKESSLRYDVANYCKDEELMKQRALHEILDRLLWKFSMENDGDKIDWHDDDDEKYAIVFCYNDNNFDIHLNCYTCYNTIHFHSREIAKRAIEEIIKPFMKKHPEFVW